MTASPCPHCGHEREWCGETYSHDPHIWVLYGGECSSERLCPGIPSLRIAELEAKLDAIQARLREPGWIPDADGNDYHLADDVQRILDGSGPDDWAWERLDGYDG